jgi:hypothetical protein
MLTKQTKIGPYEQVRVNWKAADSAPNRKRHFTSSVNTSRLFVPYRVSDRTTLNSKTAVEEFSGFGLGNPSASHV